MTAPDSGEGDDPRDTGAFRVRVPASTSNVGPGFDLLGLALSLHLEVSVTSTSNEKHTLDRKGAAAGELPASIEPANDLVVIAFDAAAARLGVTGAFHFEVETDVPVARGFGSSGASVAAGLLLANALAHRPVALDELLTWGIEIEGHPDNVTASLFGGCTLCHPEPSSFQSKRDPVWIHNAVHDSIAFALAWSQTRLSTEEARRVLPSTVAHADAVENPRRLALLLEGLRTGDPALITVGGEDRLHVRYRLPLIPGAESALLAARDAGAYLATISGAGSGLVALGAHERIRSIAEAMRAAFVDSVETGSAIVVQPVFGSPVVERVERTAPT